jgi:glycosyltransferase involved in cell wall biosynthesis
MNYEPMRRVAIVHKWIPQYRRQFFELLRDRLAQEAIKLQVIYGQPGAKDAARKDSIDLEWGQRVKNKIVRVGERELYWQPCLHLLRGADLVIVEQASKLLINYVLQARYLLGGARFAFWGHGKDFAHYDSHWLGEFVKRRVSRRVHWWFAYNARAAAVVQSFGFPADRTTVTQNAIDTRGLAAAALRIDPSALQALCDDLQLSGRNVCLYAGGMYRDKRLAFLIEACELIRRSVPDFEMIFMGTGIDAELVVEAAMRHSWMKYVGPKFDRGKVPYFMLSKLFLMPGVVGLAVLDAFALAVPMITTAVPGHGPEIDYLDDGTNGVVVQQTQSPVAYADTVKALLRDERRRQLLIAGCRAAAEIYTVENMVESFAIGVMEALSA